MPYRTRCKLRDTECKSHGSIRVVSCIFIFIILLVRKLAKVRLSIDFTNKF